LHPAFGADRVGIDQREDGLLRVVLGGLEPLIGCSIISRRPVGIPISRVRCTKPRAEAAKESGTGLSRPGKPATLREYGRSGPARRTILPRPLLPTDPRFHLDASWLIAFRSDEAYQKAGSVEKGSSNRQRAHGLIRGTEPSGRFAID
jgi:hypothetical protein